jgi:hypothetical protein
MCTRHSFSTSESAIFWVRVLACANQHPSFRDNRVRMCTFRGGIESAAATGMHTRLPSPLSPPPPANSPLPRPHLRRQSPTEALVRAPQLRRRRRRRRRLPPGLRQPPLPPRLPRRRRRPLPQRRPRRGSEQPGQVLAAAGGPGRLRGGGGGVRGRRRERSEELRPGPE